MMRWVQMMSNIFVLPHFHLGIVQWEAQVVVEVAHLTWIEDSLLLQASIRGRKNGGPPTQNRHSPPTSAYFRIGAMIWITLPSKKLPQCPLCGTEVPDLPMPVLKHPVVACEAKVVCAGRPTRQRTTEESGKQPDD